MLERLGHVLGIVHTLVERSAAQVLSLLLSLLALLVQKYTYLTPAELLFLQGAAHAARANKEKTEKRGKPKAQEDPADGIARIRRRIVRLLDGMLLRGHAADVNAVSYY